MDVSPSLKRCRVLVEGLHLRVNLLGPVPKGGGGEGRGELVLRDPLQRLLLRDLLQWLDPQDLLRRFVLRDLQRWLDLWDTLQRLDLRDSLRWLDLRDPLWWLDPWEPQRLGRRLLMIWRTSSGLLGAQ